MILLYAIASSFCLFLSFVQERPGILAVKYVSYTCMIMLYLSAHLCIRSPFRPVQIVHLTNCALLEALSDGRLIPASDIVLFLAACKEKAFHLGCSLYHSVICVLNLPAHVHIHFQFCGI